MKTLLSLLLILTPLSAVAQATPQVTISAPWVRASVPGQTVSGAFMQIRSSGGKARLVGASSPVAGAVEIHETVHENNVAKMRAIPALELPAGRTVELRPGGYHMMMMSLKGALEAGTTVPITLVVEREGGRRETVEVKAPVRSLGAAAPSGGHRQH